MHAEQSRAEKSREEQSRELMRPVPLVSSFCHDLISGQGKPLARFNGSLANTLYLSRELLFKHYSVYYNQNKANIL